MLHYPPKLILYADDDADDRMIMEETFQKVAPGFTVETVEDGFKALAYIEKNSHHLPNLLILDLNMPGMNGREVMQKVKNDHRYKDLPTVVFTTSSNPADKKVCDQYGVEMVTKPINLHDLESTAKLLLTYCD